MQSLADKKEPSATCFENQLPRSLCIHIYTNAKVESLSASRISTSFGASCGGNGGTWRRILERTEQNYIATSSSRERENSLIKAVGHVLPNSRTSRKSKTLLSLSPSVPSVCRCLAFFLSLAPLQIIARHSVPICQRSGG